jgi:rare lipoprotein A
MRRILTGLLPVILLASACATASDPTGPPLRTKGMASWYGQEFAGRTTANGEIFDPDLLTAAHRTLPFGSMVKVVNPRNDRSVIVRINDRGPFVESRIIDLSYAAAARLDMINIGVAPVEIEIVSLGRPGEPPAAYVVSLDPDPAKRPLPAIAERPPDVPFPLPGTVAHPDVPVRPTASDDEFTVEVIEERGGVATRRTVDETGRRVIAAAVPESAATRYVLQLGAFGVEENARLLVERARAIDSRVFVTEINGLHRVRVGPLPSKVAAIELQEKFDLAGLPSLLVTLEP